MARIEGARLLLREWGAFLGLEGKESKLRGRHFFGEGEWSLLGWIFLVSRDGSLEKEKWSWFGAKKTLAWKNHYLVRLLGVPRSLCHHPSFISYSCDHFTLLVSLLWSGYYSFISCFSIFFIQRWSNCALRGCFIFKKFLISWFFLDIF